MLGIYAANCMGKLIHGGAQMIKLVLVMTMAISLMTMVSFSYASWKVEIDNSSCRQDVVVEVTGDHLFWKQVDCTLTVPAGKVKTCTMPGGICPRSVKVMGSGTNKTLGKGFFDENHVTVCRDEIVRLHHTTPLDGLLDGCRMIDPIFP